MSARQPNPLVDAPQPKAATVVAHSLKIESLPTVGDRQHYLVSRTTQDYIDLALHYMHYNFARVHKTLRVTPAMEAGVANHVWTVAEIVGLLD